MTRPVVVLGVFNADTTYRAARAPRLGETIMGTAFTLGPGGKGSNQAVAAARAGTAAHIVTKLGQDSFGDMAMALWAEAGVTPAVTRMDDLPTGAASIFVEEATGNNAIIVCPGAAGTLSPADVEAEGALIGGAGVFLTQLEQPVAAARRGLELARAGGATTILNPAPAVRLPDAMLTLCDYVTPNESEAETLTGVAVSDPETATIAARALRGRGAGAVIVTLGAQGALFHDGQETVLVPALGDAAVVETTGAGDCFNGAFAAALADGMGAVHAVRFAVAAAGLSVARAGAAASMPTRAEIEAELNRERTPM